jgi:hypothetical protein
MTKCGECPLSLQGEGRGEGKLARNMGWSSLTLTLSLKGEGMCLSGIIHD